MNTGMPELTIVLLMSALLLIPVVVAAWVLVTLNRMRITQEAARQKIDAIAQSLQENLDRDRPERQMADEAGGRSDVAAACAWCGRAVEEDEAFMLRVGARLCPSCAADAGRIAAEQRLGKGPPPEES